MIKHDLSELPGEVADLMIQLEEAHHARGWNSNPPTIYRVSRENERLRHSSIRLGADGMHPRDDLRLLADITQTAAYMTGERLMFSSSAVAHMLIMESWVNLNFTSHDERHADPRDLADIPGSREARFCLAIVGDQALTLTRIRGDKPDIQECDTSGLTGEMAESLKMIHAASRRVGAW